jgi:hypothetical protein
MDQRSIALYLARKGLSAMGVFNGLVVTLGSDAKGDSSVTRFLRKAKFPSPNPPTPFSAQNPSIDDSNEAILLACNGQLFASVRKLSMLTHLPCSTVYRRLRRSLGSHVPQLR